MHDHVTTFLTLSLFLACCHCAEQSLVNCDDPANVDLNYCVDQDVDEKSVILLNEKKYEEVITLLEAEIAKDEKASKTPKYERYVRLAAAYGGRANCSFFTLMTKFSESAEDSEGLDCENTRYSTTNIKTEIDKIKYLKTSLDHLQAIPSSKLDPDNASSEDFYVNNANLFSALFKPIHANKCIKLFDFVYADASHQQYLTEQVVEDTSCSPQNLINNLVDAAQELISSLDCGSLVDQATCD